MMEDLGGYLFPNDLHILWGLMIVMYPYITGLVAGAFILSSLYHVFHRRELRPIGRLSLVASLAFLLFAPATLTLHLGHPERAFNIMITPNPSSAMAMFGFIYAAYLILLVFEIWLVHRVDIITLASQSRGIRWFHLRRRQGEPLVVHPPDADHLPVLGGRVGHRPGHHPLPDRHEVLRTAHRCALHAIPGPLALAVRHSDRRPGASGNHDAGLRAGRGVDGDRAASR
jgi:hypothetical protein